MFSYSRMCSLTAECVLQDKKTEIYKRIVVEVAEARPGVLRLMDQVLL